jgi:DNA adenine methylase
MVYMGSKNRFAKELLPIILKDRKENQFYVEPFAGGMNIIDKVEGNRIANDLNYYLIEMFKDLLNGWKPEYISKIEYKDIKNNKEKYKPNIVGWAGFICSFSGKYFAGFAGNFPESIINKNGKIRYYQVEHSNSIFKQLPKLQGVKFENKKYSELEIPDNSIIYCDPPYQNTTGYKVEKFNHSEFWEWCRNKTLEGNTVFVSEYTAPDDFECVWEKEVKVTLSTKSTLNKVEKLFQYKII